MHIRLNEAVRAEEETESALLILIFLAGNCFIFLRSRVKLVQGKRFSFVTSVMSVFSITSLPAFSLKFKRKADFW